MLLGETMKDHTSCLILSDPSVPRIAAGIPPREAGPPQTSESTEIVPGRVQSFGALNFQAQLEDVWEKPRTDVCAADAVKGSWCWQGKKSEKPSPRRCRNTLCRETPYAYVAEWTVLSLHNNAWVKHLLDV